MDYWSFLYIGSFILLVVSLFLLVYRWPISIGATYSQHASQSSILSIYYSIIFIVTMPLIGLYIYYGLLPKYDLSIQVFYIYLIATITQIICTFIPESTNTIRKYLHRFFAGISASFILIVVLILSIQLRNELAYVYFIGLSIMTFTLMYAIVKKGKYALILQSIFYLSFLIPMLISTLSI